MILLAVVAAVFFMLIGVPVFVVICGLAVYLFFISGIRCLPLRATFFLKAAPPNG